MAPQRRRSSIGATMETLRIAADKLKNSPKNVKRKIDEKLNRDKLSEDWIHNRENVQNGVAFNMKFLGKRIATHPQGQGCTDQTVEELVHHNKLKGKSEKLQKISMMVDSKKLIIRDLITHELIEDIPVHRISYCTADPKYPKVFALIARERSTKRLYTHAFLTNRKAMAEAIALTVAQAFTMAFEEWEELSKERQQQVEAEQEIDAKELYGDLGAEEKAANEPTKRNTNPFKSSGPNNDFTYVSCTLTPKIRTVEIPDETTSDGSGSEEDEFTLLAQSRTKKLDTGLVRKATFKGNVKDYLAVNNNLTDLERAVSTDDLSISLGPSPMPSPRNSPPLSRPFEFHTQSPLKETKSENLIEF